MAVGVCGPGGSARIYYLESQVSLPTLTPRFRCVFLWVHLCCVWDRPSRVCVRKRQNRNVYEEMQGAEWATEVASGYQDSQRTCRYCPCVPSSAGREESDRRMACPWSVEWRTELKERQGDVFKDVRMELSSKMWETWFTCKKVDNYSENYSELSNLWLHISVICGWSANVPAQEKEIEKVGAGIRKWNFYSRTSSS